MGTMAKRKTKPFPPDRHGRRQAPPGAAQPPGKPWIYGVHAVLAAIANPNRRLRRLAVTKEAREHHQQALAAALGAGGHEKHAIETPERKDLEALLPPGAVHQGFALLADPPPPAALEDIVEASSGRAHAVVVVLDQASDPHNIGAVLRSAAAFGALAVIVQDRHAPEVTGALAKAASGAIERVELVRVTNIKRAMDKLKDAGFWCIGLDGAAETAITDADLPPRTALVLGAEGPGLRRLTLESCDLLVHIPIGGGVESLNLSNAAAIALYEISGRNR